MSTYCRAINAQSELLDNILKSVHWMLLWAVARNIYLLFYCKCLIEQLIDNILRRAINAKSELLYRHFLKAFIEWFYGLLFKTFIECFTWTFIWTVNCYYFVSTYCRAINAQNELQCNILQTVNERSMIAQFLLGISTISS